MKKILIPLLVLFMSFGGYAQEYFIEKYNTVITSQDEYLYVDTYVEFNVYNSTDVVVHFDTLEPIRYVQETDSQTKYYEGVSYQIVGMRLAHSEKLFTFSLFETGELLIIGLENDKSILLLNTEENQAAKTFDLR